MTMSKADKTETKEPIKDDFESKLQSAKEILETLMNPQITLEDSVKAYEKGMSELEMAQKILEDAQIKINEIKGNK